LCKDIYGWEMIQKHFICYGCQTLDFIKNVMAIDKHVFICGYTCIYNMVQAGGLTEKDKQMN
jgi:hypothetical protein